MEQVNFLPGRVRYRINDLVFDKALCKYIKAYTESLYGVKSCNVNIYSCTLLILYDEKKVEYKSIKLNIENAIISAKNNSRYDLRKYDTYFKLVKKRDKAKRRFIIYGCIYLIFKIKQNYFGKFSLSKNIKVLEIASLVTIIGGYPLLKGAYKMFSRNVPTDSDILLKLSALSLTIMRESSKGVFVLVLKGLSEYMKLCTDVQSLKLLDNSYTKTSGMAWIKNNEKDEILVSTAVLRPNDIIFIHQGESIPVEGKIVDGYAIVNSLYYTGQPIVSHMSKGQKVNEGLTVISGSLQVKVINIPEDNPKPDISMDELFLKRKVNKYQKYITPIAITTAGFAYILSGNFLKALTILLVLTPSGTNVALNIGIKNYVCLLGKYNIFIRNPNAIEKIAQIDCVVFDKTGTLTYGNMKIKHVDCFNKDYTNGELLKICTACEVGNYHPISITLQEEVTSDYDIDKVQSSVLIPSKGIEATYDNHKVLIGNSDLFKHKKVDLSLGMEKYLQYIKQLYTVVYVVIDGELCGVIAMEDIIRADSSELIHRLKEYDINDISILTGDNEAKAQYTAEKLGIENVYSSCTNNQKSGVIHGLKDKHTVMMVGDGVNDAIAMREADVSVSFANSSCDQIKLHSDCIIFEDDMKRIDDFISLSRKSYRCINTSIEVSKIYNYTLGILACLAFFDTFAAKSLNTINSIIVLLLNTRIKYLRPEKIFNETRDIKLLKDSISEKNK